MTLDIHSIMQDSHDFVIIPGVTRYIRKWLPRRPCRAIWSVRRP